MRFWPFRRKKPVFVDDWATSADWNVGDLAVCIADLWSFLHPDNPRVGDVLRVNVVRVGHSPHMIRFIGLGFEGKTAEIVWSNRGFRKAVIAHERATKSVEEMIRDAEKMPVPQEV